MNDLHIGKENVGKISERIIANELEACGFLVRDLNLEGISANADLLAMKDEKVWQIQVKGSTYNPWWFQYGYCKEEHISDPNARLFNRAKGPFMANIVALVCVRSPFEYQFLLLPVDVAEAAAQINLGYAYRTKKPNGDAKKPSKVWFTLYPVHARTQIAQDGQQREQEMLRPFLVDRSRAENPELREQQKTRISELLSKVFVPSKSNETDLGRG